MYPGKGTVVLFRPTQTFYERIMIATAGLYTPMDELPQEVQDVYTYNPVGARQLLADAGYSEGDVEFTFYVGGTGQETVKGAMALLLVDWFAAIGVNAEIKLIDWGSYNGMLYSEDKTLFDGIGFNGSGHDLSPVWITTILGYFYSKNDTPYHVNDPHYDAMFERLTEQLEAGSAEWYALTKEMNDYAFTQTWFIPGPNAPLFAIWQPYFKNYVPGWAILHSYQDFSQPHYWIDQDMQSGLGRN